MPPKSDVVSPPPNQYSDEELLASFSRLQKTAKSPDALLTWLKKFPQVLPGLAVDYHNSIRLVLGYEELIVSQAKKDLIDHYNISVEIIKKNISKKTNNVSKTIGLSMAAENKQDAPCALYFTYQFKATEWHFLAANELQDAVDNGDILDKTRSNIYRHVLEKQFPGVTLDTIILMAETGLLPDHGHDFVTWLTQASKNSLLKNKKPPPAIGFTLG